MNLLRNHSNRTENEFKKLLVERYGLSQSDFVLKREEGTILAKIVTEEVVDSSLEIDVSPDGLKAHLSLYPPINGGEMFDYDQLLRIIEENGVTVNLKTEKIKNAYELYSDFGIVEKILFAEGIEPISGADANLELKFDPAQSRPKVREDGSVDYKNIDNIRLVRKGDLLLTKKPATAGVKGLTVQNEEISPEEGKDLTIHIEDGVSTDEEEKEYYATCDGCVTFHRNRLAVSPIYTVPGNLDYSIGNIIFNGVVHVKSDVLSGFAIKAEKDIIVEGIVQDANLIAGGNITIKTGIKGDFKNRIAAGGDVIIGYAEKANVEAKGNVELLKYSYNSNIKSGGLVTAVGEPGIIAGGRVMAFSEIVINQAGTTGNTNFAMAVGTKYFFEEELNKLKDTKDKYEKNLEKVEEFLGKLDTTNKEILKNPKVKQLLILRKQILENIKKTDEQIQKLIRSAHHSRPRIKVMKTMYEGLEVQFFREKLTMREKDSKVLFFYDDKYERIAWVSMEDKESQYD
ncbi:DUF342 domain-containing protein [Limisalsivibrio acetivorans]|uniref:DUF342 domain-containing protein n=1 Tax=Limisalsivibrio acetivorans TaxID=1304888 RepID=UPI0003B54503|nr:FapA family protein [Limisalsivibrio acetivorans]